jgi:hypothetical protein
VDLGFHPPLYQLKKISIPVTSCHIVSVHIALIQHYYPHHYPSFQLLKSLALGKEYRLRALQNSVLKRIFNRRDRLNDRTLKKSV